MVGAALVGKGGEGVPASGNPSAASWVGCVDPDSVSGAVFQIGKSDGFGAVG